MNMPVMDGLQATKAIREWEKGQNNLPSLVPIVALTANALKENLKETLEAGCNAYLTKPIKKALLLEAVSKHASNGKK